SESTGSNTSRTGLSGEVSLAAITQAGSQTAGAVAISSTSTVVLGDCRRAITFADAAGREMRSSESIFAGVRTTRLDLLRVKAVSLCNNLTTLPDSVAYSAAAGSGFTEGSSRTV